VPIYCSALLSHKNISEKVKAEVGITDNLIRLSVGIEDASDVMKDIDQALLRAFK
jgi:cystathionine beta-lyase/cystathionine gamma-synthase